MDPERYLTDRERLATALRDLRQNAGMTGVDAARSAGMSQPKISKLENGRLLPSVHDVQTLLGLYGAGTTEREVLLELAARLHATIESNRTILRRGAAREAVLAEVLERLSRSAPPVVLAGAGVRLSGAHDRFLRVVDKLSVPVTTGWNAHDALHDDHPLYVGRPGTIGDRAGNFAVQSADFLLVLGSRLNIRQISYNWQSFARGAFKVMVDIDAAELEKPTLAIDLPVHADLAEVLHVLDERLEYHAVLRHREYLAWCRERRRRYPVRVPGRVGRDGAIDPYEALACLFDELEEGEVVVTGDGAACVMTFQVAALKRGQRLYTNSGCASMGYDLPAAIGAAFGAGGRRVVCIPRDRSLLLKLQELQTIAGAQLPVKIFVLANNGYSSIRQTQSSYFPDNVVGCDPASGLTFPDIVAVAGAFGIPAHRCEAPGALSAAIRQALEAPGPALVELVVDPDRPFEPKLASRALEDGTMVSSPLEDMAPFLSRAELAENLLVAPAATAWRATSGVTAAGRNTSTRPTGPGTSASEA